MVGVVSSATAFSGLKEFPCDVVEARLDLIGHPAGWVGRCQEIEAAGKPVLLTMRLKSQGGSCRISDEARMAVFEEALTLSAVDVELCSKIAGEIARMASDVGKACVLSHHDFEKTPSLDELKRVVADAEKLGGVTKIATMIRSVNDIDTLKSLLALPRQQPLCVIGMGEAWSHLRVELAQLGSCLTYGFLDASAAPGQVSAATLVAALRQ